MALTDPNSITPFDPGVPSGYSTNLTAQAARQVQANQEPLLFVGWERGGSGVASSSGGKFASEIGNPVEDAHGYTYKTPVFHTPSELLSAFDNFERDDFLHLRNLLIAAGMVSPDADPVTVRNVYAAVIGQATETKMSPMGIIKNYVRMNGFDPSKIGSSPDFFGDNTDPNRTVTTVQRNVADITEGQAFSSLQGTLSQMLGRDPSDQETRDYLYRMNRLAAENPSISRTVYKYKNGEQVSSSTHTDPGFTGADMAQEAYDAAQNEPDYAEYRGASLYFNSLMSALGPIGG